MEAWDIGSGMRRIEIPKRNTRQLELFGLIPGIQVDGRRVIYPASMEKTVRGIMEWFGKYRKYKGEEE